MMDMPQKDGSAQRKPAGTAFFLSWEASGLLLFYAVTARHVLDEGLRVGASGLFLRVRRFDPETRQPKGYKDVPITVDQWVRHPDTDVAVARVALPDETMIGLVGPHSVGLLMGPPEQGPNPYATEPVVGEGDDVFFVGMFNRFYGKESVLPIVRFGNIALMPYEPISVKLSKAEDAPTVPIDAYLVEARSWGGHSGSPAWVYFPLTRDPTKGLTWDDTGGKTPKLLGLVHGHYSLTDETDFLGDSPDTRRLAANAGIAIVIPAHKITEVLEGDALKSEREALVARKIRVPEG